jgi:DNA-directed RNA polymerase sigma subunit (sigma70/sigma32)
VAAVSICVDVRKVYDTSSQTIGDTIADPIAEQGYEKVLDELELSEISAGLGVTAERVRQIEAAALSKLRQALAQPAPVGRGAT